MVSRRDRPEAVIPPAVPDAAGQGASPRLAAMGERAGGDDGRLGGGGGTCGPGDEEVLLEGSIRKRGQVSGIWRSRWLVATR